ncbi:MAG: ATP-binding cassette domain-containing protein [Candidatus Altiarchaeales archaeon]|nr:ATP-binding cassette domain-containing protein [Candidatus Altiarchaeales archaeon]MBD3417102.1 ATP-binding cassette domain-containing protein [Candidatus Altiarchaeales archaeon]
MKKHKQKEEDERCKKKPIIDLNDVWKIYRMGEVEVPALRGLTLEIFPCEFVSLMGPSGSGKSTAMNMVGCLDVPTKGHILLDGRDIAELEESDLAQIRGRKIGFIFQQFNLINNLTALENVTMPMIFQDMSSYDREKRGVKLLKSVGLEDRMYHKPTELSGGQQQRVAIARSLANDPDVILADEPTGNLDSKTGVEVMDLLSDLHKKEDKTIVMVTHDAKLSKFADRIIHIKDGKVVNGGKQK